MKGRTIFFSILVFSILISFSHISESFAHEDEGEKQRDDRIHMTLTNDSSNTRTGVTFYYTAISHTGHDHPWIGDSGVLICELGMMNPGQSKTCHGPFHSSKSPDQKPECNPVSDWNFSFLVSYNEGGYQKSIPVQRGTITSTTGDNADSRGFSWGSHTDQVFLDVDCPQPEAPEPPPLVASDPPDPPTLSVNDPAGDKPTISGKADEGTEIRVFISEVGFFGFNFFWFDSVVVDHDGNWAMKLEGPLDNGVYDVTIVSVDKETGLISTPVTDVFVIDREPPKEPEDTCLVGIPEPAKEDVVSAPFVPLPRVDGTTDLDPDLTRDDQGKNDCALIAVTNNLNYFVNTHNIPRGDGPGQLPVDDYAIIEQLRIDMNWQKDGVIDKDFESGKNTFVNRYNLPITTSFVPFPTPQQIEESLDEGKAIELNLQFRKSGVTLGHTVTVVGVTQTSEGTTIQIHDPMTKGGKTQDSYELRLAQDRSGKSFWLLMNYPNWEGYTILEGMFVQEYGASSGSGTTVPDSGTPKGSILDSGVGSIPKWIKTNALWWSENQIDDKTFALGIGHLVKENIIKVDSGKTDSQGSLMVSDDLLIPSWIKNNARWWAENSISDNDFKSGIQFMINERIIQFDAKSGAISCPSDDFCKPLIEELKNRLSIPPSSQIFYAKVEPGTIMTEEFDWENRVSLEVPKTDGEFYAFFIDYNPGEKFGHTVAYAWLDLKSMSFDYVIADWTPVITYDDQILSYSPSSNEVTVDSVNIQPENWQIQEDKGEDQKREPVYDVSHKSIATGPAPKSFKPYQKVALLIDFGDNPPRSPSSLDTAKVMSEDADGIQQYLDDNGYQTNRVSNYHGNNHPRVDSASDVEKLLEAYSKAFDCDPNIPCGHEFFLFLDGHGSKPFFSDEYDIMVGSSLSVYKADGSGTPDEEGSILDSTINSILQRFEPCVKIIVFIDSCYGGSMIQDSLESLEKSCENKPCGMTIMAGNSKRESTYVLNGGPSKFLEGHDKDHDRDGIKGDLRDRFEEMKKLQKQDKRKTYGDENPYMDDGMDAQLFLCSQNQPLCSMDGTTRIGMNDGRGVHISPESPSVGITRYGETGEWIDNGNGTFTQIPETLPPLISRSGFHEVLIPSDVSLLPGTQMYNDLEPDISSNNASWLGEKKTYEVFSINDVTFWVDTPKLPSGYFYTGKLFAALATDGPIDAKGFSDIVESGEDTYKGSFSFECYFEGDAKVTQLVSLYWQLWKGNNPNDLSSATKVTQGIVSSDRESRLICVGEDEGFVVEPKITIDGNDYDYYDFDAELEVYPEITIEEPDYTIPNEDLVELDSDGDGILDNEDSCPNNPETVNGYMDSDGCPDSPPETDSDGDGILDNEDSCPNNPETVNDYMDSDGCPDTAPIADTTPPVISVPSNTIIESSEELTPVTYNALSNDDVDGSITPTCDPPSGFLFPVGTTTVTCTATDSAGNTATKSFTVEIIFVDIKAPVITISSINSIESGDGFIVTYEATAEDNVDGAVEVSCDPPSGSFFPEGTHRITCTATDSAGNIATQAIDVTVTRVE